MAASSSREVTQMWKPEHRLAADRRQMRYSSDLIDEEWVLIKPLIPNAKRGGRRRSVDIREVINGLFYVLSTGCQWADIPRDLPPRSTVNDYFLRWDHDGTLIRINDALHAALRAREGRTAEPSVGIIDSQTAKGGQKGGSGPTRRAMMRARGSKAASGTLSSTRSAAC